MDRELLLQDLPPFLHRYTTIKKNQSVYDIVKEVLEAHEIFANDYDRIAAYFDGSSYEDIARRLFNFLKSNVAYKIESEESQTTKSPSALLVQGFGDCKHYAGFIAGVLDALNRRGKNINWNYRFASYNLFDKEPGHVFVVLHNKGKEFWIDPVLNFFNERLEPTFILDKKPKQMLSRVSGIYDVASDTIFFDDEDRQLAPEILQAINLLWQANVLEANGRVNDAYLVKLSKTMKPEDFQPLADARILLHDKSISGFFSSIFDAVKTVTLAIPRTAYLNLVLLNFRGWATNMGKIIFVSDTSLTQKNDEYMNQLKKQWDSLGGNWANLVTMVAAGRTKKAVLGAAVGALEAAAWVASATAIIAAMTPIINSLISKIGGDSSYNTGIVPYGGGSIYTGSTGGIMDFVQNNPLIVAGAAAAGIYFFTQKKHRA